MYIRSGPNKSLNLNIQIMVEKTVRILGASLYKGNYGRLHRIFVNHVLTKTRFKLNGVLKFVSWHRIF
jgi:hypothetical protein